MNTRAMTLLLTLVIVGCDSDDDPMDATTTDATVSDTSTTDTSTTDTSTSTTDTSTSTTDTSTSTTDTSTSTTDTSTSTDTSPPAPPDCGDGLLVTREGANGTVSFRLDRCMPQICGGGCPVSSPQLTIVASGRTDFATADQIVYTQTHHNWTDSLVGTLADRRLRWRVEFTFEDGLKEHHHVAIESLAGAPILAETVIVVDPH